MALVQFISGELFAVHALCINTIYWGDTEYIVQDMISVFEHRFNHSELPYCGGNCALSKICFVIAPAKHPLKQTPQSAPKAPFRAPFTAGRGTLLPIWIWAVKHVLLLALKGALGAALRGALRGALGTLGVISRGLRGNFRGYSMWESPITNTSACFTTKICMWSNRLVFPPGSRRILQYLQWHRYSYFAICYQICARKTLPINESLHSNTTYNNKLTLSAYEEISPIQKTRWSLRW